MCRMCHVVIGSGQVLTKWPPVFGKGTRPIKAHLESWDQGRNQKAFLFSCHMFGIITEYSKLCVFICKIRLAVVPSCYCQVELGMTTLKCLACAWSKVRTQYLGRIILGH